MNKALLNTNIKEYPLVARGKVRDVYDLGEHLLMIATDRISAFDWVMPNGVPGKGKILNSMSLFWFKLSRAIIPNHKAIVDFNDYPKDLLKYEDQLKDRSMIVKKAKRIDIECVARGYLIGSGWKDYCKLVIESPDAERVSLYDNVIPSNLMLAQKLEVPIFTPAIKAEEGHDENISFSKMVSMIGEDIAKRLRVATLSIYSMANSYANTRGIIIADTKFEFGFINGELSLIDEILSPDSSRFWPMDLYKPGANPPSYDKQFIRDWLETSGWDKNSPPPQIPDDVIIKTLEKYKQAHKILVGTDIV